MRYLNRVRAPFITEADVDIVARELIEGDDALTLEDFDALILAAGDVPTGSDSREVYMGVLRVIATQSKQTGYVSMVDIPKLQEFRDIINDLKDREVLREDSGNRLSIRVGLFAEWLRANPV